MFKFHITILIILLALFFGTSIAFAQDIGLNNSLQIISNTGGIKTDLGGSPDSFLNTAVGGLIATVLGFVGIIFLGLTIYSGIQWMTAGGNEEKVTGAKKKITNATIGLAVVILAYVISNAVFGLFYGITGRDTTNNTFQGQACQDDYDCGINTPYLCENGLCVWHCQTDAQCGQGMQCQLLTGHCVSAGYGQNMCENNSDCPPERPECYQILAWNMCTCTDDGQCVNPLQYCVNMTDFQSSFNPEMGGATCVECRPYQSGDCASGYTCNNSTHLCELEQPS